MKFHVLEIVIVTVVAFLSWLFVFSLDCYFGQNEEIVLHGSNPPYPDQQADNLFWFLQISDIHFSFINNLSISYTMDAFCHVVVKTMTPTLVLVSGDLTHAKYADGKSSKQFLSEWKAYSKALHHCNLNDITWLDIRGNHDNFDVVSFFDESNFFREYSMSGKKHRARSYSYTHKTSFGMYNFIAVDVCPNPGPRRPYNFFGVLHLNDLAGLKSLARKQANHTVWFTHFPSAVISTDHHALRKLMSTAIVHVCGHLHTLGGLMPHMYGKHPGGHLELELGDFTNSNRFRLMAFDHDLFSFVDMSVGEWPVVLITNPKDARFLLPSREPFQRMAKSSHVRMLVFSPVKIVSIELEIDGNKQSSPIAVDGGPLYVSPWQPNNYEQGLHTIKVVAVDAAGGSVTYVHTFSLDGTSLSVDLLPQLLLLTDFHSLFRLSFFSLWLCLLSVLLLSWINVSDRLYFNGLIRNKVIFFPYITLLSYFGIGPWYIGELLSDKYGFVCVHGVYLMGQFIPGSLTYLHGTVQVLLFHIPLLFFLNNTLSSNQRSCNWGICKIVMVFSLLFLVWWTILAYPYGLVALIVSPGCSWQLVISLWLIHRSQKICK